MSNIFGSCQDKHTLWTTETVDGITTVTFTSNVEGQEPVSICFGLKGAEIVNPDGENTPIEVIDGVLQLPEDMFGSGEIDVDASTYTLTMPGQDPVVLCTDPLKEFSQDPVTGVITATSQSGVPFTANVTTIVDNGDNTALGTNFDGSTCNLVKASAFSVVDGEVILTLPAAGINGEDISDDISVELVTIEELPDGTFQITGTIGPNSPAAVTCIGLKPPVAWTPADVNDSTTWLADAANPGDYLSWVKDANGVTCGFILNGVVCTVPKISVYTSTAAGTDDYQNDYAAGAEILVLADGTEVCLGKAKADTAGANETDAWGNPVPAGANGIRLANGDFVCIPEKAGSLSITKCLTNPRPQDGPFIVGETAEYSYIVVNTGAVPLTVNVTDDTLAVAGGPVVLAPGAIDDTTFTGQYTITADDLDAGFVKNRATATGTTSTGGTATDVDVHIAGVDCVKKHGILPQERIDPEFVECFGPLFTGQPGVDGSGDQWSTGGKFAYNYQGKQVSTLIVKFKELESVWDLGDGLLLVGGAGQGGDGNAPQGAECGIFDAVLANGNPTLWNVTNPRGVHIVTNQTNVPEPLDGTQVASARICYTNRPTSEDFSIDGCESEFSTITRVIDIDNGSVIEDVSRPWEFENLAGGVPLVLGEVTPNQANINIGWQTPGIEEDLEIVTLMGAGDAGSSIGWMLVREAVSVCCDIDGNILSAEAACQGDLAPGQFGTITITGEQA